MNLPNIKDILGKLSVLKNNLSLLIPIIIGLIAILLFIPTQLLSGGLRKQMENTSASIFREVQSQMRQPVSREQWQVLAERQQDQENDAKEIGRLAEQTSQRELLSYNIFPDANDPSPLIFKRFGSEYRSGIDRMMSRLKANECPSKTELEAALKRESESSRLSGRLTMNPYGLGIGGAGRRPAARGRGSYGQVQNTIVDEVCLSRAKSCLLYANPGDLGGYGFWADYKYGVKTEDALKDCWYYQLGYWIVEDIFKSIEAANAGHQSVLTAPVKRLMSVSFTMGLTKRRMSNIIPSFTGGQSEQDKGDRPAYVMTLNDGLTEPCTGRFCDEAMDVVHFNVTFVVGAKDVMPLIQELSSGKDHRFSGFFNELGQPQVFKHNQITVLESNIRSISDDDRSHQYYRYGDEPVVTLDLVCEYIFNKKGYDAIKPEAVKKTLRGEDKA